MKVLLLPTSLLVFAMIYGASALSFMSYEDKISENPDLPHCNSDSFKGAESYRTAKCGCLDHEKKTNGNLLYVKQIASWRVPYYEVTCKQFGDDRSSDYDRVCKRYCKIWRKKRVRLRCQKKCIREKEEKAELENGEACPRGVGMNQICKMLCSPIEESTTICESGKTLARVGGCCGVLTTAPVQKHGGGQTEYSLSIRSVLGAGG